MKSRPVLIAGRVALWAAVVLILGRGVVSLFTGPAASGSPAPPEVVGERYPAGPAEAFAARFTADYLTYDETNPGSWTTRTAAYGLDLTGAWDGKGTQAVTSVIPADLDVTSPTNAVVTVAAQTGSGWVHLAVPVASTKGGLAVAARPAFVAGPKAGKAPESDSGDADAAAGEAVRPTVEAFLTAYGKGEHAVITALSADGTRLPQLNDAGRFTLAAVEALTVPKPHPGQGRWALVTVQWADSATGAGLTQTYQVGLTRTGERWLVNSLGAVRPEVNPNPVKEKR